MTHRTRGLEKNHINDKEFKLKFLPKIPLSHDELQMVYLAVLIRQNENTKTFELNVVPDVKINTQKTYQSLHSTVKRIFCFNKLTFEVLSNSYSFH